MMKYLLIALLAAVSLPSFAQVKFKIEVLPDNETYLVSFVPEVSYTYPGYLIASGQITIRVPHGIGPNSFEVADLTMQTAANWDDNARVNAPVEAPSWDYISFGLVSFGTSAYPFVAGTEFPVFSFKNGANFCADSIEIVNNLTDPFLPPNSAGININNTLVVLGGGLANSYAGPVGTGKVECMPGVQCTVEAIDNVYLCEGETYQGQPIAQDTSWDFHYTSFAGCDSAFITHIFVNQDSIPPVDTAICQGKIFHGVVIMQDEEITVNHVGSGGCDSTVTYYVQVLMPSSSTQSVTVLPGQAVVGIPVFSDTTIVQTLAATNGCDSVATIYVGVFQVPTTVQHVSICQGDTYLGEAWPQDTVLIDTLTTPGGFDSFLVTNILVNPVYQIFSNVSLCAGDSYLGTVYTQDDSFIENLFSVHGCDSTVVTNIDVVEVQAFSVDTAICEGELFLGQIFTADTSFLAIVPSANGCDSLIFETNLQVLPAANPSITGDLEICGGETSTLTATGGTSYAWSNGQSGTSILIAQTGDYAVTVTTADGCSADASVQVSVSSLDVDAFATPPPCEGDLSGSISFGQVNGGIPPYAYSIDGGEYFSTHTDFPNLSPGSYNLRVRDAYGCFWENKLAIEAPSGYFLDLGPDESIRLGESVELQAFTNLTEPADMQWLPATDSSLCDDCYRQELTPLESTTYRLVLTDSLGCQVEAKVHVTVEAFHQVYLPTAFSPNGDGLNDQLFPQGDPQVATVRRFAVFDRWGALVFLGQNLPLNEPGAGWDGQWRGQPALDGTYAWMAEVAFIDGTVELFEGGVVLLR